MSGGKDNRAKLKLVSTANKATQIEEVPRKEVFIEETLKILKVDEGRWEVWAKGRYLGDIYKGKCSLHAPFGTRGSRSLWKVIAAMMNQMESKLKDG